VFKGQKAGVLRNAAHQIPLFLLKSESDMTQHRAMYKQAFFDLQWHFARKVALLSGVPLAQVLLKYTNLYIRFGLGRDFNPAHPAWQAYLAGLQNAHDQCEWTYHYYLTRTATSTMPPVVAQSGCFSYALLNENRIRLHFQNTDTEHGSSLSISCVEQRRADLTALFQHVQRTLHGQIRVVGVSWLYNLPAYCRLFPTSYITTARIITDRFHSMPLWGQFLDRNGDTKESMTRPFLASLEQQSHMERLHECFPFQVITVDAQVQEFYNWYGL
jgi:hypothetical protein